MPRRPSTVPHSGPPQRALPQRAARATPAPRRPAKTPIPAKRGHAVVVLRWGVIAAVWLMLAAAIVVLWFARDLPRPDSALDAVRRPSLTLEDRVGHVIATFGDFVGQPVHLKDVPAALPEAVVAVEDRRFWHHFGLDPVGLARAAFVNLFADHVVQGGSTLTQQVAKTLFLTNARTLKRKVQEVLLTLWLERHFSKQEILEIYLNRVYLGAGAWGVDAASRLYFGVPVRRLSLGQAALLAGLPRAPSRFNPRANPSAALARARQVLDAMVACRMITADQARRTADGITFPAAASSAPGWFTAWAAEKAEMVLAPGADAVIRTTLDLHDQAMAESRLAALLSGPGAAAHAGEGAVVILDADSGAVRAMVGGRSFHDGPFNRAVAAHRQPGSAFKPFVWLAALESGLSPQDVVQDTPIRIGNWQPANFEHRYLGAVSLEDALAQSLNTVSVRLLLRVGGPRVVAGIASRLGIAEKLPRDASLALGTGEVGLLELTASYAAFVNGGLRVQPYALAAGAKAPERVIDPPYAAMMAHMLGAVVERGTGRVAALPGYAVVGKTGTTQDSRDAWFIGAVKGRLIGIWLGNDDDQPMKAVTGGDLPARLFHDIAEAVK